MSSYSECRKNSLPQIDNSLCTGCAACVSICASNAIRMENIDWFTYPRINERKCILCGKCQSFCESIYLDKKKEKKEIVHSSNVPIGCLAVWADDDVRVASSSGGAFWLLSKQAIDCNGYVVGAAFVNFTKVKHIVVNTERDLDKLRKSKYVQSNTEGIYDQVAFLLNAGRTVLFSGTPCQIDALYRFLKFYHVPINFLVTIDILCHGVPSQKIFDKYLDEEYAFSKIECVDFRYKLNGWTYNHILKVSDGNEQNLKTVNESSYYRAFLGDLSLRESCGQCRFASLHRMGDISLGDFWGVWTYDSNLDDRKGTSLVLINTEKGKKFFENVKGYKKCENVPLEIAVNGNLVLSKPSTPAVCREEFLEYLKSHTVSDAVEKYL